MFVSTKSRLGRGCQGGPVTTQGPHYCFSDGKRRLKSQLCNQSLTRERCPLLYHQYAGALATLSTGGDQVISFALFLVCQPFIDYTSILNSKPTMQFLVASSSFIRPATTTLQGKQQWACSLIKPKKTAPWIRVMTGEQGGEGMGSKKTAGKNCCGRTWRKTLIQPVAQEGFSAALIAFHSENNVIFSIYSHQ